MIYTKLKYLLSSILLIFITFNSIHAQKDCFPKKSSQHLVYDEAKVLTNNQLQNLDKSLIQYANATSTQIVIVIVKDLCGYDKAAFTYTLGQEWGVGQKEKENGIVIMVKPTGGKGQRHTFIATGYGLEGVIPDATAKRIVEKEMIPRFKENDFYGGLIAASSVIMKLAEGEFSAQEYNKKNSSGSNYLPIIIFIGIILFTFIGRSSNARTYARRNNIGFWTALMLMSSSSRGRSGSYGGFSSGGGGFGGFGGGSFGGGGAGGSW